MNFNTIFELLIDNEKNSKQTINMVPSENYCSVVSRMPMLLDLYNRYFFNVTEDPENWNFRGSQQVAKIETEVAIPLLKELAMADHVSLRPISGLSCMSVVLSALGGGQGSNILTVSPDQGGHFASKSLAESLGLNVDFIGAINEHEFDFNILKDQLNEKDYSLVYIDQSHCLFPIDVKKLTGIVKESSPDTLVHIDASHWIGLILGEGMPNPLSLGADSFGGTTHKTFPGPQRAIFATNVKELINKIENSVYFTISSHHFGSVAALALSLLEFKEKGGKEYANNVLENGKLLAKLLSEFGYDVKGKEYGFTAGHQIWVSTNSSGVDSYLASERLYQAGIRVNAFDELPGSEESILRLGVNEFTRFGAKSAEIYELATIMHLAIQNLEPFDQLKLRVKDLRRNYDNSYGYDLNDSEVKANCTRLINELIGIEQLQSI
jgi:glycine hydroxymethyltransferase